MVTKSYKLKIYANKGKLKELNKLLAFWQDQVNHKIKTFWGLENTKNSYPPTELSLGGRLKRDSSVKAWQIVKGARATKQLERPIFNGTEIDLNSGAAYIIPDLETKEFDLWFNVINLNNRKRLKVPCKKTGIFNMAVAEGKLKKSFKLQKVNDCYYMVCFVEFPEERNENTNIVGIDVGLNNTIAVSDGNILGKELKDLRIRTKHRKYKKRLSPVKQGLNHYAKTLVITYPETDFAVEQLLFKGKHGRNRKFRRRNNTWPYMHLQNKLEFIGKQEGFLLIKVHSHNTSQRCPVCGFTDRANRAGELFRCISCGHQGNADTIGAINIERLGRVVKEYSVPLIRGGV